MERLLRECVIFVSEMDAALYKDSKATNGHGIAIVKEEEMELETSLDSELQLDLDFDLSKLQLNEDNLDAAKDVSRKIGPALLRVR